MSDNIRNLANSIALSDQNAVVQIAQLLTEEDFATVGAGTKDYIEVLVDAADWLTENGDAQSASLLYTRALERAGKLSDADVFFVAGAIDRLAISLIDDKQYELAASLLEMSLSLAAPIEGTDSESTRWRLERCMFCLEQSGNPLKATELLERYRSEQPASSREDRTRRSNGAADKKAKAAEEFDIVPVHFGTHRDRTGRSNPYDYFRGKRNSQIQFGLAKISVPRKREIGSLPTPPVWMDERRANPSQYIVIKSIDLFPNTEAVCTSITSSVSNSEMKELLFFIHGYNTSFSAALNRAAQLSTDLEISGATVLYSWPSKGSLLSYVTDRNEAIDPVISDIKQFLAEIVATSGAKRIHLVAHSMGSEFLLRSLEKIVSTGGRDGTFAEVIFASPDIDAADFASRISSVRRLAQRTTVYASSNDSALRMSELLNGATRAGSNGADLARSGADIVDTTTVSADFLGHSDYAATVVDDLRAVVWLSLAPPKRRVLKQIKSQGGNCWVFDSGLHHQISLSTFRQTLIWARRLEGVSDAISTISRTLKVLEKNPDKSSELAEHDAILAELRFLHQA